MTRLRWDTQTAGDERAVFGPWVARVRRVEGSAWYLWAAGRFRGSYPTREAARAAAEAKLAEWLGEIDAARNINATCAELLRDRAAMQAMRRHNMLVYQRTQPADGDLRGWVAKDDALGECEQGHDDPADAIFALVRRLEGDGQRA